MKIPSALGNTNPEASPMQVMLAWFDEQQLNYEHCQENNLILSGLRLKNIEVGVECGTNVDGAQFLIIRYPMRAPEPVRQAVGEFLLRLNYAIKLSLCEMDFNDGEIRLRNVNYLAVFCHDRFSAIIAHLLLFADNAYPYLASVIARSMKPDFAADQALAAIQDAYAQVNGEESS